MTVTRLRKRHLDSLRDRLQAEQSDASVELRDPRYAKWLLAGDAWALVDDAGECIAAAGTMPKWEGSAIAWALLSDRAARPSSLLRLTKEVLRYLHVAGIERVETVVRTDFAAGHRWAKFLGFTAEGNMHRYWPGGVDCTLYARVS